MSRKSRWPVAEPGFSDVADIDSRRLGALPWHGQVCPFPPFSPQDAAAASQPLQVPSSLVRLLVHSTAETFIPREDTSQASQGRGRK